MIVQCSHFVSGYDPATTVHHEHLTHNTRLYLESHTFLFPEHGFGERV
jgi:hypothetical protein